MPTGNVKPSENPFELVFFGENFMVASVFETQQSRL